jgi:hypothetical protein
MSTLTSRTSSRRHRNGINRGESGSGWLFTAPTLVLLGLFLVVPIGMALWVSLSNWNGNGSPFTSSVKFVGLQNFNSVLGGGGLTEQNFGQALKNNAWYVLLVVPTQTVVALFLDHGQPTGAQRPWSVSDRVLLSLGNEFGRDHRALAVSLQPVWSGQQRARLGWYPRSQLVQ